MCILHTINCHHALSPSRALTGPSTHWYPWHVRVPGMVSPLIVILINNEHEDKDWH